MAQELREYELKELGKTIGFWSYRDDDFVGFSADMDFSRGGGGVPSSAPECSTRFALFFLSQKKKLTKFDLKKIARGGFGPKKHLWKDVHIKKNKFTLKQLSEKDLPI